MERLERKIDRRLVQWAENLDHQAAYYQSQIGKTEAIKHFAVNNYKNVIEINFVLRRRKIKTPVYINYLQFFTMNASK